MNETLGVEFGEFVYGPPFDNSSEILEALDKNKTLLSNSTSFSQESYIFDRTDVKAAFITLYTIVFCSCFFGNLMVILVVTLHWRMRSITNFCLGNLAVADFCVGIFCVYQNILQYTMESWIFGELLCKMYHFISSLSTTASLLILVVICIERYLAILHPMQCKQMLTLTRLRITIVGVWVISALISSPRLIYFSTVTNQYPDGYTEIVCIPNRMKYNSKMVDMISMVLLFILPLMVITILYFRIGIALWKSSSNNMPSSSTSADSSSSSCRCDSIGGINTNQPNTAISTPRVKDESTSQPLNCLKCKKKKSKRQRRSSGSFYGASVSHLGNGNYLAGHGSVRNINGLQLSSHENFSLQELNGVNNGTTLETNGSRPASCCNCVREVVVSSRGETESVPVSPYLKRDSTPVASINTEPIVLVKFEKKSSLKKSKRRNQCTILMRSENTVNKKEDNGVSQMGHVNIPTNSLPSAGGSEECGNFAGESGRCQVLESNCDQSLTNSDAQKELCTKIRAQTSICEKNFDDGSRLVSKDLSLIQAPPHIIYGGGGQGNHCACSCQTVTINGGANQGSTSLKALPNTVTAAKGPKKMRIIRSSKYGARALACRKKIIKMLIIIVVMFAICHMPFHFRKVWQYWGKGYEATSVFSSLFTPITSLIMYAQSAINPILYAFMSKKFRSSFTDILCCNMRKSLKISRNLSVRSTNQVQLSLAA